MSNYAEDNNNDSDVETAYDDSCNFDICEAIAQFNTERLFAALRNPNLNIDYIYPGQMTCLHLAVKLANREAIELLVAHGADININTEGTPLHLAIVMIRPDLVELLVKLGANVNTVDKRGYAPLYIATVVQSTPIVKCLLENGATPDSWNSSQLINYLNDLPL